MKKMMSAIVIGWSTLTIAGSAAAGICQGTSPNWNHLQQTCAGRVTEWWGENGGTSSQRLNVYLWAGGGNSNASIQSADSLGNPLPNCSASDTTPSNGFAGIAFGPGCQTGVRYIYTLGYN